MSLIDKGLLYTPEGTCLLCLAENREHVPNCPGRVIEGMHYEVSWSSEGSGWGSDSKGSEDGSTLDEAILRAARESYGEGGRLRAYVSYTFQFPEGLVPVTERILAEHEKIYAQKQKEEERRKLEEKWKTREAAFAALEAEKPDLTEAAYQRRRSELVQKFSGLTPPSRD